MVQKVTVPDIGVIEFPDSMSPQDIVKALQSMQGVQAPRQPKTVTEKVLASPVGGVIRVEYLAQGHELSTGDA